MSLQSFLGKIFGGSSGFVINNTVGEYSTNEHIGSIYDNPAFTVPNIKKVGALKVIEFGVYKDNDGNKEKLEKHILADIFEMPNEMTTWGEFLEYLVTWYDAQDNGVLIEKIHNGKVFKPLIKIWNPDNFTIYARNSRIDKIDISNPARVIEGDELQNFLWLRQPNVENNSDTDAQNFIMSGRTKQRGLGILGTYNFNAWRWNNQVVKNGNSRGGIYSILNNKSLPRDEEKKLKEKIYSENSFGNKGKDLVVTGELKYTPTDHLPKDTEFPTGDITSYNRMSVSLGVPPELAGSGMSTYANRKEAKKEIYEDTLIPFCRDLCRRLNYFLKDWLKPGEYIDFDTSSIPALQGNLSEVIDSLSSVKDRLTINEYRALLSKMTDISLDALPNGDKLLVPGSNVELDDLVNSESVEDDANEED